MINFEKGKIYYECNIHKQFGEEVDELEFISKTVTNYIFKFVGKGYKLSLSEQDIKNHYGERIRETREEAQKDYDDYHNDIRQTIENENNGLIDYMLEKLLTLTNSDETGYVFTPDELKIFKDALKEKYNKEFNYEN